MLQKNIFRPIFPKAKAIYHKFGSQAITYGRWNTAYYDTVVAYQDGMATWYVARAMQARRKIAFVHTDFCRAGYDADKERQFYAAFDQICFGSQASRSSFLQVLPEYEHRTKLVANGVSAEQIRALSKNGKGFADGFTGLRILTVGRLSREKGVYKVPELIRRLKGLQIPFRWYLIGDGPVRKKLAALSRELPELILLGQRENPYPYMRQCDIYVQPSDYEGYCIALSEARILYRPCVVCDFSGAEEQIKHGETGLVVGFGIQELFDAVAHLMTDSQLRARLSVNLEKDQYSAEISIKQWISTL